MTTKDELMIEHIKRDPFVTVHALMVTYKVGSRRAQAAMQSSGVSTLKIDKISRGVKGVSKESAASTSMNGMRSLMFLREAW